MPRLISKFFDCVKDTASSIFLLIKDKTKTFYESHKNVIIVNGIIVLSCSILTIATYTLMQFPWFINIAEEYPWVVLWSYAVINICLYENYVLRWSDVNVIMSWLAISALPSILIFVYPLPLLNEGIKLMLRNYLLLNFLAFNLPLEYDSRKAVGFQLILASLVMFMVRSTIAGIARLTLLIIFYGLYLDEIQQVYARVKRSRRRSYGFVKLIIVTAPLYLYSVVIFVNTIEFYKELIYVEE